MRLLETVLDVIAPYDCLGCETEGSLICSACWPCMINQQAVRLDVPGLGNCWAVTEYRGLAKLLVRAMKVDAQRQACWLIARAMHETAPILCDITVISVPTATTRVRERGFDHGRLIAREFARVRRLPYRQLLVRHGHAKQAGASKRVRSQQLRNSYQVRSRRSLPRRVLVIDDVMTTGATLSEVTQALQKSGVKVVEALVFAHV